MMLFPDVQRRAQAEMDELFGKPTLPSAADQTRLPYVNAIVKEAIRWHTVTPMGIPHKTDEDDIINGYLIPKNAIILPNIWYSHSYFCTIFAVLTYI
jgi:cytochrome P450